MITIERTLITLKRRILHKENAALIFASVIVALFCLLPIVYAYTILFSAPFPPGSDSSRYVYFSRLFMMSGNPFLPYSQFYLQTGSYFIRVVYVLAGIGSYLNFGNVVLTYKVMMLAVFVEGLLAFLITIRRLATGDLWLILFTFFLISVNAAPVLMTLRDGSYGGIFATWLLLPLLMFLLLGRRLLLPAIALSVVFWTHNLSAMTASLMLVSMILSLAMVRDWPRIRRLLSVAFLGSLFSVPPIILSYFPKATGVLVGQEGLFQVVPFADFGLFLTDLVLYSGIVMSFALLMSKQNRWLSIWLYFMLGFTQVPFTSSRIVRDLTIPLSLITGVTATQAIRSLPRLRFSRSSSRKFRLPSPLPSRVLGASVLILLALTFAWNGFGPLRNVSNSDVLMYFTPTMEPAYKWLESNIREGQNVLTLKDLDPWILAYLPTYSKNFEVYPPAMAYQLSALDREINEEFTRALLAPSDSRFVRQVFEKYNISYLLYSNPLPGRWYDPGIVDFASQVLPTLQAPFLREVYSSNVTGTTAIYRIEFGSL